MIQNCSPLHVLVNPSYTCTWTLVPSLVFSCDLPLCVSTSSFVFFLISADGEVMPPGRSEGEGDDPASVVP